MERRDNNNNNNNNNNSSNSLVFGLWPQTKIQNGHWRNALAAIGPYPDPLPPMTPPGSGDDLEKM